MADGKDILRKYILRVQEACGDERRFVMLLKPGAGEVFVRALKERGRNFTSVRGILVQASLGDKQVSVFRTGKLVVKGVRSREELDEFLRSLLADRAEGER